MNCRGRVLRGLGLAVAVLLVGCDDGVDPEGCGGCLDQDGVCQGGASREVCGAEGAACSACGGDQECLEGRCESPPACSPLSCGGCCEGDLCVEPTELSAAACGSGGGACSACSAGASCVGGRCEGAEGCADECGGCCDEAGLCQVGDGEAACGAGGAACSACGAGEICSLGRCIGQGCGGSCDGCCSGDTCLAGDSSTACGVDGAACVECGSHRACEGGACLVDEGSRWDVIAVGGVVPERNAEGEAWDLWGGLPDPFLRLTVTDDPVEIQQRSAAAADTLEPRWFQTVLEDVTARAILGGVTAEVLDEDFPDPHDPMGQCTIVVVEEQFDDTPFEFSCDQGVGWSISLRLREH